MIKTFDMIIDMNRRYDAQLNNNNNKAFNFKQVRIS